LSCVDEIINDSNPYDIFANVQHIGGGYVTPLFPNSPFFFLEGDALTRVCVGMRWHGGNVHRGFSQVYSAVMKASGQKVAIKKMSLDEWYEQDLLVEIVMMKVSKHHNIVSYIDTYRDDRNYLWVLPLPPPPRSLVAIAYAYGG
jgi:hypothetical protein